MEGVGLELGSKCTRTTLAKAQRNKKFGVGGTGASVGIISDVISRHKGQGSFGLLWPQLLRLVALAELYSTKARLLQGPGTHCAAWACCRGLRGWSSPSSGALGPTHFAQGPVSCLRLLHVTAFWFQSPFLTTISVCISDNLKTQHSRCL